MSDDDVDDELDMAAAMAEQNAINEDLSQDSSSSDMPLEDFSAVDHGDGPRLDENVPQNVAAVYDVPVHVSAVLGRTSMQVSQLLKLSRGAVIELDRRVGEAIDIYVNNRLVARGEVVVVDDYLGITMTEIIKSDSAQAS